MYRDRHKYVLRTCTAEKIGFRIDYILRADLSLEDFDSSSGNRVARTLNLAPYFSTICQYFLSQIKWRKLRIPRLLCAL